MDEQRVQAYLSLIQELLECPGGEEPQILSQSSELLDGGFVQVCIFWPKTQANVNSDPDSLDILRFN